MTDESESAAPIEFEESAPAPVVFSNRAQFDRIGRGDTQTLLLFYRERSSGEVILDPENDLSLYRLFAASPYTFDNRRDLLVYESLITRAQYQLRLHPAQEEARELAATQLSPDEADDLVVFVYQRDQKAKSPVQNRQSNPFVDLGLEDAPPVILFRRYSHDPFMRVLPVWRHENTPNANTGLLGVQVIEAFY